MKKTLFFAIAAASMVLVSCNKPAEPASKAEAKASVEVEAIQTASALAQYGFANESAIALAQAADILVATPQQELEAEAEKTGNGDPTAAPEVERKHITVEGLLSAAKEFAGDDEVALQLIARVEAKAAAAAEMEANGVRGRLEGPTRHHDRVLANDYDLYRITFVGSQIAEVAVIGDGDTDLDLYVYDQYNNLIASDTDNTDRCYVSFIPNTTSTYTIKIRNWGRVYNNYTLLTN